MLDPLDLTPLYCDELPREVWIEVARAEFIAYDDRYLHDLCMASYKCIRHRGHLGPHVGYQAKHLRPSDQLKDVVWEDHQEEYSCGTYFETCGIGAI